MILPIVATYIGALCAVSGRIGGLTNPCPGAENVEPVIENIGGPPKPRKRAAAKKVIEYVLYPPIVVVRFLCVM